MNPDRSRAHPWFETGNGRVVVMSHHGLSGDGAPDGSLEAYRAAYALGYRWFQLDVVPIKDDLISMHSRFGVRRGCTGRPLAEVRRRLGYDVPTVGELLGHPGLEHARWNIELKGRASVPQLVELLKDSPASVRVLVSAPMHPFALRELRDTFGDLLAIAAPVHHGGALGLAFMRSLHAYDSVQVHHWFARRRVKAPGRAGRLPHVQVWTIDKPHVLDAVMKLGCHPIVGRSDAATRDLLIATGRWAVIPHPRPSDPVPSDPVPSDPVPTDPVPDVELAQQQARRDGDAVGLEPIKLLMLGGGGWRGAFGAIGAVMYLHDTQCWSDVRDVVSISGGSFVAAALGADGVDDTDPSAALGDLIRGLLSIGGPVRRRLAALGLLLPLGVVPPVLLLATRWLASKFWRNLLRRVFGDRRPRQSGAHRYVICATGRESAMPYYFCAGDRHDNIDGHDVAGPDVAGPDADPGRQWIIRDVVLSATALPWVTGTRTRNRRDGLDSSDRGRGEVLIDGGVTGMFGNQFFQRPPWATASGDGARTLVVDSGRVHRRGGRVLEWVTSMSTVAMLGRWLQIALDSAFRNEIYRTSAASPISAGTDAVPLRTHLVRVAETDEADLHSPGWTFSERARRIEHGRRIVHRFGLTGLNERNALTTIVVAVAACAAEFEADPGIESISTRLHDIGARLGVGNKLVDVWRAL